VAACVGMYQELRVCLHVPARVEGPASFCIYRELIVYLLKMCCPVSRAEIGTHVSACI
jgi:hypothetical protein